MAPRFYLCRLPQHLHIICLNVPYPVDFGAMYDLFYKLPALQQAGIAVHLHCFTYDRPPQKELEKYCASVQYYPRHTGLKGISLTLPYIVASRQNEALMQRLLEDDYPIVMEGVHCSYPVLDARFRHRRMYVRLHNVEYQYYYHLYKSSRHLLKKIYYKAESILLKKYERRMAVVATGIWTVSPKDAQTYTSVFDCKVARYLPLFLPPWQVAGKLGSGAYCIYHANLAISENEEAALWLVRQVFAHLDIPLLIAGKNPSQRLLQAAAAAGIRVVANPTAHDMDALIADAQLQVLPSFNATGIKIKLLNALYNGRHCLVNSAATDGTGLEPLCHIANTAAHMQAGVKKWFAIPFSQEEKDKRKATLHAHFNNAEYAQRMIEWINGSNASSLH